MQHHHRHKNNAIVVILQIMHQVGNPIRIDPVKTLIINIIKIKQITIILQMATPTLQTIITLYTPYGNAESGGNHA